MYKTDLFLAHCVSKEGHIRLQDSTTFTAGWDLEIAHLLICQEDIPIRSHAKRFSFPSGVQSFKVLLELRTQDLVSTGQAENPEIQREVLMESFMSAEDLEILIMACHDFPHLFTKYTGQGDVFLLCCFVGML